MSSSWALTTDPTAPQDIFLDDTGNWAFVRESAYVAQSLKTRLNFYYGEWFLDTSLGVDYFGSILVKPADIVTSEALIKDTILNTKDVTALLTYNDRFSPRSRVYGVDFSVTTVYSPDNTAVLTQSITVLAR